MLRARSNPQTCMPMPPHTASQSPLERAGSVVIGSRCVAGRRAFRTVGIWRTLIRAPAVHAGTRLWVVRERCRHPSKQPLHHSGFTLLNISQKRSRVAQLGKGCKPTLKEGLQLAQSRRTRRQA